MGHVIFVGAGPGAADLITLRGAAALGRADVVLCDALTDPALRELAPGARWIDVGKRGYTGARTSIDADGGGSVGQSTINALLVKHATASGCVVRLKGGDPSIFGRLEEEIEALVAAGIGFEIVPGVTAALAAAAHSRRPLTRRGAGRSVGFATAMTREGPVRARGRAVHQEREPAGAKASDETTSAAPGAGPASPVALLGVAGEAVEAALAVGGRPVPAGITPPPDTEVYYMAGRLLGGLGRRMLTNGWRPGTPISVVSRAGWPDALQSDHTVATLDRASVLHAGRPTVVVVGVGAAAVGAVERPPEGAGDVTMPDAFSSDALLHDALLHGALLHDPLLQDARLPEGVLPEAGLSSAGLSHANPRDPAFRDANCISTADTTLLPDAHPRDAASLDAAPLDAISPGALLLEVGLRGADATAAPCRATAHDADADADADAAPPLRTTCDAAAAPRSRPARDAVVTARPAWPAIRS